MLNVLALIASAPAAVLTLTKSAACAAHFVSTNRMGYPLTVTHLTSWKFPAILNHVNKLVIFQAGEHLLVIEKVNVNLQYIPNVT